MNKQEQKLKQREEFFKKPNFWIVLLLITAIILAVYIRVQPMMDHNGNPGLWDVTTDTWTLGPDLDPWLFFRNAKQILNEGSIPEIDTFRSVPRGAYTDYETKLLPYMIVGTYHLVNIFGEYNIEFAGVIFPVLMFVLTILAFFLFVRELFRDPTQKSQTKPNIMALISTFIMITVPTFLTRTIAGIPEKESAAFFFMFLAFYLYLRAHKTHKSSENQAIGFKQATLSILAGISTALMALIWGGYLYIFLPIAVATFTAFIFNKINWKEFWIYLLWFITTFIIMFIFSARYTLEGMLTSLAIGPAVVVLFIIFIHLLIWQSPLKKFSEKLKLKINLPKSIISLIIAIILLLLTITIFLGPQFIIDKVQSIHKAIFKPVYGRWNITVAENRQPFFTDWRTSMGPVLGSLPLLFWLSFVGSIVLFKRMLKYLKKKDAWRLTIAFIIFLCGLVFSRYSATSIFNGENLISKSFYYGATLLFAIVAIYYYIKYNKEKNDAFEKINFESLFILALFIIGLFTARGAIRLLIVLSTIAPVFVGYLCVKSYEFWKETDDDTKKAFYGVVMITVFALSFFMFLTYYRSSKSNAYNFVPSVYNIQWQKAMQWVRDETPQDSVFISWWDYGYWIQGIGNRATVLDGGNGIPFWNYNFARFSMTTDNEFDLREFNYNHNVTHLLIDSTDVGKYGAFASIGSDENYDRLSYFGTFLQDEQQTQETQNETTFVYRGGVSLDEDMVINDGTVLLPAGGAGVGLAVTPFDNVNQEYKQPSILASYQGQNYEVKLRYLYLSLTDEFIDFGSGVDGGLYIYPKLTPVGGQMNVNSVGAAMYLSPRLMRGFFTQVYLLNDPFNNFPNVELVHTQDDLIIEQMEAQGIDLPDWIYYQGNRGPISIFTVNYLGDEKVVEQYHAIDYSPYISWRL